MNLSVPFFSQLDENVPEELRRTVCSIACVKMILDFKNFKNSFGDLYKETGVIGGREKSGLNHETLVRMLRNHGVLAYRQEFLGRSINPDTGIAIDSADAEVYKTSGINKIRKNIDQGNPVIISVHPGFSVDSGNKKSLNMTSHMVLVTGHEDENFYINDPVLHECSVVAQKHLVKYWRRLAIFVE